MRALYAFRRPRGARKTTARRKYTEARVEKLYQFCQDLLRRMDDFAGAPRIRGSLRLMLWDRMMCVRGSCYKDSHELDALEGCAYALALIAAIYSTSGLNMQQRLALLQCLLTTRQQLRVLSKLRTEP